MGHSKFGGSASLKNFQLDFPTVAYAGFCSGVQPFTSLLHPFLPSPFPSLAFHPAPLSSSVLLQVP